MSSPQEEARAALAMRLAQGDIMEQRERRDTMGQMAIIAIAFLALSAIAITFGGLLLG